MSQDAQKKEAAVAASRLAKPGMVLGLGTGSTVQFVLEELARRQREQGERFLGVATSKRTEEECKRLGIQLTTLREHATLDLTIDGADELDDRLNLIKGGGGALLREKVVAASSKNLVIVADQSKVVPVLGSTFPVPVEVVPYGEPAVARWLQRLDAQVTRRQKDGKEYVTDNGNVILDARFQGIPEPAVLERTIKMMPGVAEVGLFCGMANQAFVAGPGGVREAKRLVNAR